MTQTSRSRRNPTVLTPQYRRPQQKRAAQPKPRRWLLWQDSQSRICSLYEAA